jgi:hypothetical protein
MVLLASDSGNAIVGLLFFVGLALAAALYFTPTIVAFLRHSRQRLPVLVLNLLLGWTFVGWVVSLVMAVGRTESQDQAVITIQQYGAPAAGPEQRAAATSERVGL